MHDHSHSIQIKDLSQKFIFGILLNIVFVIIEACFGFYYDSLALLSDAGHNLSDVTSLLLALIAIKLAKVPPDSKYTYGFRKTTVLVSLLNAIILLFAMGTIVFESINRFQFPKHTSGNIIALVSGIGIIINTLTALLFLQEKDKDLNVKGAYLHMMADALVSFWVLITGILIEYTNWFWLDGAISISIAIIVLLSSFQLLRSSFNLSIDAVPEGIEIEALKLNLEKVDGVLEVHHIHIWAISTTLNAFTAHIKIKDNLDWQKIASIKENIRHILAHENILHSTIEIETNDELCHMEKDQI